MSDPSPILILTRPRPASEGFARKVEEALGRSVDTIVSPLIRIDPVDLPPEAPGAEAVILTSANAVPAVSRLGLPEGTVAWCVGSRTAEVARAAGLDPRDAGGDAEDLIDMILRARPKGRLLHLRGEKVRADVADRLSAAGLICDDLVVYRQVHLSLEPEATRALAGTRPVVMPVFSPATGAIVRKNAPFAAPVHAVAMSPTVAQELADAGFADVATVAAPDGPHMIKATARLLGRLSPRAA